MQKYFLIEQLAQIATLVVFSTLCSCASSPHQTITTNSSSSKTLQSLSSDSPPLPTGKWIGQLELHTIPDVDNDGTWMNDVVISNCNGVVRVQWTREDGSLDDGREVQAITLHPKVYLLYRENTRSPGPHTVGWVESQHWTLVDASPKDWTLTLTRTVLNDPSQQNSPWFTFRWMGWGSMQYSPTSCD